jgi:hypothetical protein
VKNNFKKCGVTVLVSPKSSCVFEIFVYPMYRRNYTTYPGDGVVRPLDTLDGVRLLGVEVADDFDRLRRRSLTEQQKHSQVLIIYWVQSCDLSFFVIGHFNPCLNLSCLVRVESICNISLLRWFSDIPNYIRRYFLLVHGLGPIYREFDGKIYIFG